jgi:hypothetical protein
MFEKSMRPSGSERGRRRTVHCAARHGDSAAGSALGGQIGAELRDDRLELGELVDAREIGSERGKLGPPSVVVIRWVDFGCSRRSSRQEVHPARLARAGWRGSATSAPAGRVSSSRGNKERRAIGEAVEALGVDLERGDRLRPAQHQQGQERGRLRRHVEHTRKVVRVPHHPAAARLDDERQRAQMIDHCLHVRVRDLDNGISARLLVAAGDERVERKRIRIRYRMLLLDEHAEDARLEQRQRRRGALTVVGSTCDCGRGEHRARSQFEVNVKPTSAHRLSSRSSLSTLRAWTVKM